MVLHAALMSLYWRTQVDAPSSRGVSRELAELQLQLPGEAVESEGKAAMVALMTALPFGVAAGWMLLVAKSSQRMGALLLLLLFNYCSVSHNTGDAPKKCMRCSCDYDEVIITVMLYILKGLGSLHMLLLLAQIASMATTCRLKTAGLLHTVP